MLRIQSVAKSVVLVVCLCLVAPNSSAMLLGNLIGCNSFGCRLAALENDVAQLKQQVSRLGGSYGQPGSNFGQGGMMQRPNGGQPQMGGGQNMNPNMNQQGQMQGGGNMLREGENKVSNAVNYQLNHQNHLMRNPSYPIANQFRAA